MSEDTPGPIVVKKYANRRLYDTANSRYVNLKQISELIKEGHTLEVVDASTGEDLTKVTLTHIILEEERGQGNLLPTEFLHEIIKYGESAYGDFFQRFLNASLEAYRNAQEQMDTAMRSWVPAWPGFPRPGSRPTSGELEQLKQRIAELEARLQAERTSEVDEQG